MTTELDTGIAQNGTRYIEAEKGSIENGFTHTQEIRFEAQELTKKMKRIGLEAHPAGTIVRTLTVTGAGDPFPQGGPNDYKFMQRFYCAVEETIVYDAE